MATAHKLRLFLQKGIRGGHRYIAWFELRGNDLYWGPPSSVPDVEGVSFNGRSVRIKIPEDLDQVPRAHWKASRHASGLTHVNTDGSGRLRAADAYVGAIDSISQPTLIAALIDKPPSEHPPYCRSLTRGRSSALVLRIPERRWNARQYFEFYLTPGGTFPAPKPMLAMNETTGVPFVHSLDVDLDIALAVRHASLDDAFSAWRPNVGVWLHVTPPGVQT